MPMSIPRLYAEPVRKIDLQDASGWLYRWNNGDMQMMWIVPPPPGHLEDVGEAQRLNAD